MRPAVHALRLQKAVAFRSGGQQRVLIEQWRRHCNEKRPHSSLRYMTPSTYAAKLAASTIEPVLPRRSKPPATGRSAACGGHSAAQPVGPSETAVQCALTGLNRETGSSADSHNRWPEERGQVRAALFLFAMMIPTAFAMLIDPRAFQGINVWIKPLKFQFALAVYLATLTWFADWLPNGVLNSLWYRGSAALVVFAIAAEAVWGAGAAALGVGSHFNSAVRGLYPLMVFFAVVWTSASLVYCLLIWRYSNSRLDPSFRLSVALGLVLTFGLTLIVAMTLSSQSSHYIGASVSDARGFAIMGWSRDGGDLRVAHFFSTHAMHAIPFAGFVTSRAMRARLASVAVIAASVAYTAFVSFTFVQALQGKPFTLFGL